MVCSVAGEEEHWVVVTTSSSLQPPVSCYRAAPPPPRPAPTRPARSQQLVKYTTIIFSVIWVSSLLSAVASYPAPVTYPWLLPPSYLPSCGEYWWSLFLCLPCLKIGWQPCEAEHTLLSPSTTASPRGPLVINILGDNIYYLHNNVYYLHNNIYYLQNLLLHQITMFLTKT